MELLVIAELFVVLTMIFIGARVGGIGLGIYGMIGVFVLVYGFGLKPGSAPIDVMMIIVAVITAAASLQASGGLEYLVGVAAKFFTKTPLANHLLRSFNLLAFLSCCRNSTYILFVVAYYF
jgi:anaerobic C4-dicarboxylate transporter dcuB